MKTNKSIEFDKYLSPGEFINSDHSDVIDFTMEVTKSRTGAKDKIVALYYAVRDQFRYDPYTLDLSRDAVKASSIVNRDYGYCIEKSCLFAAGARVLGIPSRMGFSNVRNHVGTADLEKILKTDILVFHGYAEIEIENKWIKVTPVFNETLCHKLNVAPLDFDGVNDAFFQEYDQEGGRFMEYLHHYGTFADVPYEVFIDQLQIHYPHLKDTILNRQGLK
ncbi:MAG: transglutaminase-like domain-containing protein [Bacteroidota bacterium]